MLSTTDGGVHYLPVYDTHADRGNPAVLAAADARLSGKQERQALADAAFEGAAEAPDIYSLIIGARDTAVGRAVLEGRPARDGRAAWPTGLFRTNLRRLFSPATDLLILDDEIELAEASDLTVTVDCRRRAYRCAGGSWERVQHAERRPRRCFCEPRGRDRASVSGGGAPRSRHLRSTIQTKSVCPLGAFSKGATPAILWSMGIRERFHHTSPSPLSTDVGCARAVDTLTGDERIAIIYLFGSRASGSTDSEADFDFAIHTTGAFTWDDLFRFHLPLSRALESGRFDLVWLNRADPVLTFDAVATGVCLWYADAETLNDFELKARKRFWDYSIRLKKRSGAYDDGVPS